MVATAGGYGAVAAAGFALASPAVAAVWALFVVALGVAPLPRQAGSVMLSLGEDGVWRLRDAEGTRTVRFAAVEVHPGCILLTLRGGLFGRRIRIPADACSADVHRRLRKALRWF